MAIPVFTVTLFLRRHPQSSNSGGIEYDVEEIASDAGETLALPNGATALSFPRRDDETAQQQQHQQRPLLVALRLLDAASREEPAATRPNGQANALFFPLYCWCCGAQSDFFRRTRKARRPAGKEIISDGCGIDAESIEAIDHKAKMVRPSCVYCGAQLLTSSSIAEVGKQKGKKLQKQPSSESSSTSGDSERPPRHPLHRKERSEEAARLRQRIDTLNALLDSERAAVAHEREMRDQELFCAREGSQLEFTELRAQLNNCKAGAAQKQQQLTDDLASLQSFHGELLAAVRRAKAEMSRGQEVLKL